VRRCFEILWSVETEWGQAIFGLSNYLIRRALVGQSLQSIMGATDIFQLRVNGMHSIHESYLR
jgi:hypothetical protein